ncbi:MAG: hypothetical protein ACYSU7_17105 [Planctomycetota bacterium]
MGIARAAGASADGSFEGGADHFDIDGEATEAQYRQDHDPGDGPCRVSTGNGRGFRKRFHHHRHHQPVGDKISTEPRLAAAMGVRVAQGEAVYKPLRPDQVYELTVDAAGGMSLLPLPADDLARSPDHS